MSSKQTERMISRRDFLRFMSIGAAGAALAACAQGTPAPTDVAAPAATTAPEVVELTFFNWASAEEVTRSILEEMIAKFEGDHAGVKIKNVQFGFGDIQNQTIIAITGGNPPDIVQQSSNMPFELAAMGALEPLDSYVSQDYLKDNFPGALQAGTIDGQLYALPYSISPHAFWYNRKLMDKLGIAEVPTTIEAFNQAAELAKAQDVYAVGLDTTKRQYALVHQWPWMLSFGTQPIKDNVPYFDSPDVKAYYEWLRMMLDKEYCPPGMILRDFRQFGAQDKEVFVWDGPYIKGIMQSLNEGLKDSTVFYDTWGVAPIPVAKGTPITVMDIHQLVMSKACKHKELAWEFIQFLAASDMAVEKYYTHLGTIPPVLSQIEKYKDNFSDPISQAYINDIIPNAQSMPFGAKFTTGAEFIATAMQQVVTSQDPLDEILGNLQNQLKVVYGVT
jgi:multiple sugar transport system substrate-binding protein